MGAILAHETQRHHGDDEDGRADDERPPALDADPGDEGGAGGKACREHAVVGRDDLAAMTPGGIAHDPHLAEHEQRRDHDALQQPQHEPRLERRERLVAEDDQRRGEGRPQRHVAGTEPARHRGNEDG